MMQSGFEGNTLEKEKTNGTINYLENTRLEDSDFLFCFVPLKAENSRGRIWQHDQSANNILVRGGERKRQLNLQ